MTLDSKLSKAVYQGNGSTTVFPFAFKVWNTSQITVTMTDAAGVSTDVTSNSTVTLASSGGSVTYPKTGSPLPTGAKLAVTRNMPFTQGINLVSASRFDPQVLEDGLDQATAERQQTLEMMARAVILPVTSDQSPEDVVASIYASRDAAAASADTASAQATAAQNSAQAASEKADESAGHAAAAAQSAENAYAASEGMAPRMDAVEEKNTLQDTRLDGVEAVTVLATPNPGAGKIPVADGNGKLDAWVSQQTQYATSSTASATTAKDATSTGFVLARDVRVFVTFANANTAAGALTLNVNGTGAKSIYDESGVAVSATNPAYFPSGCKIEFIYDGTNWVYCNRVVDQYVNGATRYRMFSNGFKEQWGALPINVTTSGVITYPLAFKTTDYNLQYSFATTAAFVDMALGGSGYIEAFSITTTGFWYYSSGANSSGAAHRQYYASGF